MNLSAFRDQLNVANPTQFLREGLIGEGMMIPGEAGDVPLVYADYVASGRALKQVEAYVTGHVLPYYANSHTDTSFTGAYITQLREEARGEIARLTNATDDCSVIFAGAGATAGLNRLVALTGVNHAKNPVVFVGPYEHHSNILPWRESNARVIEIPEATDGGPDLDFLTAALLEHENADLKIGTFSAASNVTGVITDTDPATRILKAHGALAIWDYAGGAPYLSIDMGTDTDAQKDAVVLSAHKFPGGPGASGVLIVRDSAVSLDIPSWPGGGTVEFVSPWEHDYTSDIAVREEAGTPHVIGDIRAALAFMVKDSIGQDVITAREHELNDMALQGWSENPHITILGVSMPNRLPVFSFLVKDAAGNQVDPQVFTRVLSKRYGIQARGGCACAGPYGHRLLGIDREASDRLRVEILGGNEASKPGWVRLNFSYLLSDQTAQFIIDSVNELAFAMAGAARVSA